MTAADSPGNTASRSPADARSPLSDQAPTRVRELPQALILEQLRRYYDTPPPPEVVECDYSLWRCSETGLEFAWPMVPGNAGFYRWVSQFESYYPGVRWEYRETLRLIQASNPAREGAFKVLDVGCGKGDFLSGLDFIAPDHKYALDLNEPAIQACRDLGFHAFCGTIEAARRAGFLQAGNIPWVTSFHCLEHVADPVAFLRSLVAVTAPGGRVLISTPYSPMSFESEWFDVLNHPPHHMTRWNLAAHQKLAALLGLKLRWMAPPAPAARRALAVFRLLRYGPNRRVNKARYGADLLCRLPKLASLYCQQRKRGQKDGLAADVILVEFTVP